eukprot:8411411-Alexandrium_andersonii.AAC.1
MLVIITSVIAAAAFGFVIACMDMTTTTTATTGITLIAPAFRKLSCKTISPDCNSGSAEACWRS